ncbi:MAG: class I SAM-dependent RNA methyltransferase [Bacilli bacterium]|nr:class I SAM-dependent RNA methyltransferase [Bacilli bacterium]
MTSVKIERLDDFGRGITYVDSKVCFVPFAIDSEEVTIEIEKETSKYDIGHILDINKKSDNRIETKCPYYDICGGCNIMHMRYSYQLDFKKKKVESILSRFASINNVIKEIIPTCEFGYRNKVSLKVKDGRIGYYKEKTNDLVAIDRCLICSDAINEVIGKLSKKDLVNVNKVLIRSNYKNEVLLVLYGKNIDKKLLNNIEIPNLVYIDNDKEIIIKGSNFLIDKIGELLFKVSYNSFFQVNRIGVDILYNKVLEYSKGNRAVDLYCGTGTIGLFLSKKFKEVYGVEIMENAVLDANYNKKLNDINNISFLCSDVALVKDKFKDVDLVVIDPPRSGLSSSALNNVLSISSNMIVYVSCDPVTLARDLKKLKMYYDIKEVTIVDMFPNSYHCESITVLERR